MMNAKDLISLIEELPDSGKHIFQDVDDYGNLEWWITKLDGRTMIVFLLTARTGTKKTSDDKGAI